MSSWWGIRGKRVWQGQGFMPADGSTESSRRRMRGRILVRAVLEHTSGSHLMGREKS